MRTIKKKLNSQRGASLTFALLLFLVCAVVGSVVLVAGTAASGRLAGNGKANSVGTLAETEQRYYAVNSAAELMQTELTSGKTTATSEKTSTLKTTTTSIYILNEDGSVVLNSITEEKETNSVFPAKNQITYTSVPVSGTLSNATKNLLKYFAQELTAGEWKNNEENWNNAHVRTTPVEFTVDADGKTGLKVDAEAVLELRGKKAGDLTLTLKNYMESGASDTSYYRVQLKLSTDLTTSITKTTSKSTPVITTVTSVGFRDKIDEETGEPVIDEETGEKVQEEFEYVSQVIEEVTETTDEIKTSTVQWKLTSMKVMNE